MTDQSDPSAVQGQYNFTNLPIDPIPDTNYTGIDLTFAFLTATTVDSVIYQDNGTYYNGSGYDASGMFSPVTSEVEDAYRTIMKVAAPGSTYTPDYYSAYYGDVANVTFDEQTSSTPNAAITVGALNDTPGSPLFSNVATVTGSIISTMTGGALTDEVVINGQTIAVGDISQAQLLSNLNAAGSVATDQFSATIDASGHLEITTATNTTLVLADGPSGHTGGLADLGLTAGTKNPDASDYASTLGWNPISSVASAYFGDIWLNDGATGTGTTPLANWNTTISPGSQLFSILLHELGHSLGLVHPNGASDNSIYYTVMISDIAQTSFPGMSNVHVSGLQMDDIYAIQNIYGANFGIRSGNDVYGLGQGFGATGSTSVGEFVYTIWDGGGTNVIDASSYTGPAIINLNQTAFSSIGPADSGYNGGNGTGEAWRNVAIAYGTVIQNAIGTQGADTFVGNPWNDVMAGTGGSNTFYSDQVLFNGTPGIDWVGDSKAVSATQWSTDPNYVAPLSLKDDVLIGDGSGNTFYSGVGNNVIDGGYNKSVIDSATSGWSTYWDSAHQFTADSGGVTHNISGTPLATVAPANAGANSANYSLLSNEDTLITSGHPGIDVTFNSSTGQGTVLKGSLGGTAWGSDGTDTLIAIQTIVGTQGDDFFSGANGQISPPSGADAALHYFGGAGNDTYSFDFSTDYGFVAIDDSSGTADKVVVNNGGSANGTFAYDLASLGTSDQYLQLNFFTVTGITAPAIFLNKTQIDLGTSIDTIQFNNKLFNAKAFVDEVVSLDPLHNHTVDEVGGIIGYTQVASANGATLNGDSGPDILNDNGFSNVTMVGSTGNDTFILNSASDVIQEGAGGGTDTVQSSVSYTLPDNVENLTLTGTSDLAATGNTLANIITGNSGNNTLDGGAGSDTLNGGAGNDTYMFHNGSGQDIVSDSSGSADVISFDSSVSASSVSYSRIGNDLSIAYGTSGDTVTVSGYFSSSDTVEDVTFSDGTLHDATYISQHLSIQTGTSGNDVLTGTAANDVLLGLDGNDTLIGLAGNDSLDGGTGADVMTGGTGNDTYFVDNAGDVVNENPGEGTDTVIASISYALPNNVENLTLTGTSALTGTGNSLDNVITSNSGADTLVGGGGNDTFVVNNASDVVTAGSGNDTIQSSVSWDMSSAGHNNTDVENLTLIGSANINGTGNSLNNVLTSNTGIDTLTGGLGDDTYIVNNPSDVLVEGSGGGTDTVQSSVNWTLGANFENLTLIGTGNINGTGNSLANIIIGNGGNNVLGDGGIGGNDTMTGGLGDDTYVVQNAGDVIVEGLGGGNDTVETYVGYSLPSNVENLTLMTGGGGTLLTGNDLANTISDFASIGGRTLDGGAGADTMITNLNSDTYIVDNTGDVVIHEAAQGSGGYIYSSVSYTLPANVFNLTLTGTADINATGNSGNLGVYQVITGNSGNNVLDDGGAHASLTGGVGNDTYYVHFITDVITENPGEGTDTVFSSVNFTLPTNVENLTLIQGSSATAATGNSANNIITANSNGDTLDGGAGTDTLVGGTGNDTLIVDNSGDVVTGGGGTDTIQSSITWDMSSSGHNNTDIANLTLSGTGNLNGTGNSLNNVITGNSGNNTLSGGAGDDTLDAGSAGTDTLIGGTGNDTYIVSHTGVTIVENSGEGTDTVQSSVTFSISSLTNVENLTLTGSSAIIGTGNSGNNILIGNGVSGTSLVGGAGNDTYYLGAADTAVESSSTGGTDTVYESRGNYTLGTNIENLVLTGTDNINGTGNTLANVITGNAGNNTLSDGGAGGNDTLIGNGGNDTFVVANSGDTVTAGSGNDTIQSSITWDMSSSGHNNTDIENLTLTGSGTINGTGNNLGDVLDGNAGSNTMTGGTGNDTLWGGTAGTDTLAGGSGDDIYIVDRTSGITIVEAVGAGTDTVQASVTYTLGANIENLTLTGTSAINGTGNTGANVITGNSANNVLNDGGAGGNDSLIGGGGNDTFVVANSGDVVIAGNGTDTIQSSVSWDMSSSGHNNIDIENLTLTGTASINGTGNTLDNWIVGNSGVNILTGGGGNDTLDGGTGADTLIGGAGNDTFIVDNAGDVVTGGGGTDTIQSSITWDMSSAGHNNTDVVNLTLTGSSAINAIGNNFGDVLNGNSGSNTITGGTGNDTLWGGTAGTDSLVGGAGNDTYIVDRTTGITIIEASGGGTDTVQSSVTYTLSTTQELENLTLTGTTAINGTGNTLDNHIIGNSAANILSGSSGNDTLDGGDGLDSLTGGTGSDTFVFHASTAFNNIDVVTDFKTTDNDKIDISDVITGYHSGLNIDNFVQLVTSGSNTLLKVDTDGSGTSFTQIATLNSITGLNVDTLLANGELIA